MNTQNWFTKCAFDLEFLNQFWHIHWGMVQRRNATTNSFYKLNQDATTNTDATTNAEEYYRPT